MASLFDQIKQNAKLVKRGSQLFEAAPDSLANQVKRQGGLPGGVVSPEAAAGMGMTQDQAKMAGSGAQLQKAIRESVEPEKQLPRQAPTRTVQTESERAAKAKAEQMSTLEGLGARVSGLVKGYLQEASAASTVELAKPKADLIKIKADFPSLTEAQLDKVKTAVESGTIDAELWTIFPQAKSADELTTALAKYNSAQKEIVTTTLKNTFGPNVTLAQLKPDDYAALGLQGLGDIASILGRPESELRSMSIDEFQSSISNLMQQNFDRVEELSRVANDAFYPANVRESAQAELRALSSTGVQATEADMQKLNESIQSADTIMVGDEEMTVAELLSDEGMTSVVASYLDDVKGDYQALIKEQFPALATFIEQNKQALKSAADRLSETVKTSANIQQANAKVERATDANVLMTDFNKTVFGPDYDPTKPTNTDWSLRKTEAHKVLDPETKEFSAAEKSDYAKFLNEMSRINPDLVKSSFANLNAAALRASIPAGLSFQAYLGQLKDYHSNIKNLADPQLSSDRAVFQAFGDDTGDNFRTFLKNYQEINLLRNTGLGDIPDEYRPLVSILDTAMADGKLDATEMADVRTRLQDYLKSGYNLATGKSLYNLVQGMGAVTLENNFKTLWAAVKDGNLTAEEAANIIASDSDTGNITGKLYDVLNTKAITAGSEISEQLKTASINKIKASLERQGVLANVPVDADGIYQYVNKVLSDRGGQSGAAALAAEAEKVNKQLALIDEATKTATSSQKDYLASKRAQLVVLLEGIAAWSSTFGKPLSELFGPSVSKSRSGRSGTGGGSGGSTFVQ